MNRVEWVKQYRELNGCGLKEALKAYDNGEPLEKKEFSWLVNGVTQIQPAALNVGLSCSDQAGEFIRILEGGETDKFDLNRLIQMSEKGPDELHHMTRCVIQALLAIYKLGAKGVTKVSEGVQITED